MDVKTVFDQIKRDINAFIQRKTSESEQLWQLFLPIHPADIATFLEELDKDDIEPIFIQLPEDLRLVVFSHMPDPFKMLILSFLDDEKRAAILSHTPMDELTDLFESFSDQDLRKYLTLLSKKDRLKVVSLLQFDSDSAGGIMDTDVLTLMQDFTVARSIHVLQRLQPRKELHRNIYVTDQENYLVGYITLEDLVLKLPDMRLSSFMREPELRINVHEDKEEVAKKMRHYEVMFAPVLNEDDFFLGIIASDTLIDIIEQEASEDVYHMSAMPAIKYPYFETSFLKMLVERSYILIVLLLAQSLSSMIIKNYEAMLTGFLMYFITMLVSTGGNSSSQTSAVVIQGMASGQITSSNVRKFLRREFTMAVMMAVILGAVSFVRAYFTAGSFLGANIAVSLSLSLIVLVSVVLGSCMPLILRTLRIDPAFAAGPFLATLMDILGLLIYCYVSKLILC